MPSTYSGDPSISTKDQVRFLVRDTTVGSMVLSDEEIEWLLTQEQNVYMAAAAAAEQMVERGVSSRSVGGLSISIDIEGTKKRATELRMKGRAAYEVPTAGGISIGGKQAEEDRTDRPASYFKLGLHDHPEVPSVDRLESDE